MPPPPEVVATTILDYILLPFATYMCISLYIYLSRNQQQQARSTQDENLRRNAKRITISAMTCAGTSVIFLIVSILRFGWPTATPIACDAISRFFVTLYATNKCSIYAFIYFRVTTFSDFINERVWRCLSIMGGICTFIYVADMIGFVVAYNQIHWTTDNQYCLGEFRGSVNLPLIFGTLQLLMDVAFCVTGLAVFARLFWGGVLSSVREKDPEIRRSAQAVVLWSTVALVGTVISLAVTLAFLGDFQLVNVDVTLNTFCICMQYPKALVALWEYIFNANREEVTAITNSNAESS